MSIGCFLTADVAFCREQKTKGKHPHTHNNTMSAYAGLSSLVGTTLFFYGFLHTGKLRYAEVETIKVEKRKLAHAHVVDALKAENNKIAADLASLKPEFEALKRDLYLRDNPEKAKSMVLAEIQAQ